MTYVETLADRERFQPVSRIDISLKPTPRTLDIGLPVPNENARGANLPGRLRG